MNVYLPDELAEQLRQSGLSLSALAQDAVRRSLRAASTDAWLVTLGSAGTGIAHEDALAALDAAREDASTPHG